VAEIKPPQPMDAAGEALLYDEVRLGYLAYESDYKFNRNIITKKELQNG